MMKLDLLYLLPALAVLICLTGAVLPFKGKYSKTGKPRRRYSSRTVLTARYTVLALLLATIVTIIWPVKGVDSLVQGLVTTFMCLIPLVVYLILTFSGRMLTGKGGQRKGGRRSSRRRRSMSYYLHSDSSNTSEHEQSAVAALDQSQTAEATVTPAATASNDDTDAVPIVSRSPAESAADGGKTSRADIARVKCDPETAETPARTGKKARKAQAVSSRRDNAADIQSGKASRKQDTEVREQMDRVSTLVKSYDLGDEKDDAVKRGARVLSSSSLSTGKDQEPTDLASHNEQALQVSRTEALRKVIATLQDDKRKLQRLVIAQQAAFDSERQSHERTRHVARDAIKVMRDARSGQRMAEKIARRERAERRRLEKEYTKVTRALKNAMSTLANAEANPDKDSTSAA